MSKDYPASFRYTAKRIDRIRSNPRTWESRMRYLTAAAAIASASIQAGEIPAGAPETVDSSFVAARSAEVLDWDQDGDLDIVGGAFIDRDLTVWLNQQAGWIEQPIVPDRRITDVAVGDIDGDGSEDLVFSSGSPAGSDDGLSVIINGIGIAQIDASGLDEPNCVILFDPDQDGDLDVASCEFGSRQITYHANGGDGQSWTNTTIATPGAHPINSPFVDLVANDVDLDGDQDLIALTISELLWVENRLNESASWRVNQVDPNFTNGRALAAGDVDGDGQDEIVAAATPGLLRIFAIFDRPAVITDAWAESISSTPYTVSDIDLEDVDQDGDLDMVVTSCCANGQLWIRHNDGTGSFSEQDLGGSYDTPGGVAPADLDLDGDLDFVIAGGDSNVIETIENLTIRSSVRFEDVEGDLRGPNAPVAFGLTDLDGDGDLDVVSYDTDQRLRYRDDINDPGTLLQATSAELNDPQAFALADIDNDGDTDVVMGLDDGLEWLENNGFGSQFSRNTVNNTSDHIDDVLVLDLNQDGQLDIVGYDAETEDLYWWRNSGGGSSFFRNTIRASLPAYRDVATGDVDDDGQPELILAADGSVKALSRIADTAFSETQIASIGFELVLAEDFDLDGDIDVISYTQQPPATVVWRNASDGNWTSVSTAFQSNVQTLRLVDVDRDGDPDIVGASLNGSAWKENKGGTPLTTFGPLGGLESGLLDFGDIDRDGDPDFVGVEIGGALQFVETVRGQFQVDAMPAVDSQIAFGTDAQLLRIDVEHLGRASDEPIELESISVAFDAGPGAPLDAASLDELFVRLYLLRSGDGQVTLSELTTLDQDSPVVFTIQPPVGGADRIDPPQSGADSVASLEIWGELESNYTGSLESLRVRLTGAENVVPVGVPLTPFPGGAGGGTLSLIELDNAVFSDRFEAID